MSLENTTMEEGKESKLDIETILNRGGYKIGEDAYYLPGGTVIRLNGHKSGKCDNYKYCGNYKHNSALCTLDKGLKDGEDITGKCYAKKTRGFKK